MVFQHCCAASILPSSQPSVHAHVDWNSKSLYGPASMSSISSGRTNALCMPLEHLSILPLIRSLFSLLALDLGPQQFHLPWTGLSWLYEAQVSYVKTLVQQPVGSMEHISRRNRQEIQTQPVQLSKAPYSGVPEARLLIETGRGKLMRVCLASRHINCGGVSFMHAVRFTMITTRV